MRRMRFADRSPRERGVVLIWFALMLLVLMGFAGFAVDLSNWWLQADRLQRAADAGAHAGVVYLPADVTSATSTATATVAKNGYRTSGPDTNATIEVSQEPNPNRLRVVLSATVDNYFLQLLGVEDVTLTREAVAEYIASVPMGSPENKLGNDPERGYTSPQFWINIAGPNGNKQSGDRYQSKNCSSSTAGCTGSAHQGIQNDDYAFSGYTFALRVTSKEPGQPLLVRAYDPAMVHVGDYCEHNMPTQDEANALQSLPGNPYPDASARYAPTPTSDGLPKSSSNRYMPSPWCTGDQDIGGRTAQTTYRLMYPDNTPWDDTDNPPVPGCTVTMPAFTPNQNGRSSIYNMLHPTAGPADGQHVIDPDDGVFTFAEVFRRTVTLCSVDSSRVVLGDYILQVRTNVRANAPTTYDRTVSDGGHNRLSLQAGFGLSGTDVTDGSKVSINARGRLPIYNNATGADTNFFLARVLPYDAGRTLRISLFDISDVGDSGTMQILPPAEVGGTFSGCSFANDQGKSMSVNESTCTLVVPNGYYNERDVTVDVPIPEDYNCNAQVGTACWITVRAKFNGPTSDTTTWSASILGNPIRLVE